MNKRIKKKKTRAALLRAIEEADSAVCFVKRENNLIIYPFFGGTGKVEVTPTLSCCGDFEITVSGYIRAWSRHLY